MKFYRAIPVEHVAERVSQVMEIAKPFARVHVSEVTSHSTLEPGDEGHFFNLFFDFFPDHAAESEEVFKRLNHDLQLLVRNHSSPSATGGLSVNAVCWKKLNPHLVFRHVDAARLKTLHDALSPHSTSQELPSLFKPLDVLLRGILQDRS